MRLARRTALTFALLLLVLAPLTSAALGQKKPEKKDAPTLIHALPPGVDPGKTTRVVLRGLKVDAATAVRVEPAGSAKVTRKGKVAVPNTLEASKFGDSEVEVELTVPASGACDAVRLVADTPGGASNALAVLIDRVPVVPEKEPNNGFEAQPIQIGDVVQGLINGAEDVDTFKVTAKPGQRLKVVVRAARLGSPLDPFLTVHDDRGQVLAACDDLPGTSDAEVTVTVPPSGVIFATVSDANDQGSTTHVYRLMVQVP